jgi:methyl-accepting chemotaxis protein
MSIWRKLSIQNKLVLSMTTCLLIFIGISSGLSIWLIGDTVRERVVQDELPTAVNGIRADVQRQLAGPITAARAIALDPFLQQWEADGEPEAGAANWTRLAANIKAEEKAASVQWVSAKTGNYYTEAGLQRKAFLASGKPYEVNMDRDVAVGGYMMFINARVQGAASNSTNANDAASVAGMALSVDALAAGISSYKIGQTGFAYLVHPDGAIMMHRDTSLVDGKHFLKDTPGMPADTAAALLADRAYVSRTYPAPGGTRYIATSFIPELNAYVVVEVPQAELLGPFERTIRTATLIAAVRSRLLACSSVRWLRSALPMAICVEPIAIDVEDARTRRTSVPIDATKRLKASASCPTSSPVSTVIWRVRSP